MDFKIFSTFTGAGGLDIGFHGDFEFLDKKFLEYNENLLIGINILLEKNENVLSTINNLNEVADKNQELAEVLRIKGLPTLMIYKEGVMMWRQSGELDANTIIGLVQEQI